MKKSTLLSTVVAACATLSLSNCAFNSQLQNPKHFGGEHPASGVLALDTTDCKVICPRAQGESKGFSLFGLIPIIAPSETDAISRMYQDAQKRGAKIAGESQVFANTSVERNSKYFFLFSIPTVKSSGDLVQYVSDKHYRVNN